MWVEGSLGAGKRVDFSLDVDVKPHSQPGCSLLLENDVLVSKGTRLE